MGLLKNLEGFRRETTQICLENEDVEGDRESHQTLLGGITSVKKSKVQRVGEGGGSA